MPKEVIKEWPENKASKPQIEVRWGKDHFNMIQVIIDRGEEFTFLSDRGEYGLPPERFTGLALSLDNKEDAQRLIKALQRAVRKTF